MTTVCTVNCQLEEKFRERGLEGVHVQNRKWYQGLVGKHRFIKVDYAIHIEMGDTSMNVELLLGKGQMKSKKHDVDVPYSRKQSEVVVVDEASEEVDNFDSSEGSLRV
jgi:hypothetical protein